MLIEVLSVVTPVFVIASIGYVWVTRKQPFDNHTISSLVMMRISNCITPYYLPKLPSPMRPFFPPNQGVSHFFTLAVG